MKQHVATALISIAKWLLKVPLATVRLVIRVCKFLLSNDPHSRRQVLTLACILPVFAVARILVRRAAQKRQLAQSRQSVFIKRYQTL
jgi:hypothetical protein